MGWFDDKYCSSKYYLIKSLRDKYCKDWDEKREKASSSGSDKSDDDDDSDDKSSSSNDSPKSPKSSSSSSTPPTPAQAPVVAAPTVPAPSAPAAPAQPRQAPAAPAQRPADKPSSTSSGSTNNNGNNNNGNGNNGNQNRDTTSSVPGTNMPNTSAPVGNPFPEGHDTQSSGLRGVESNTASGMAPAVICGVVAAALLVVALFLFVGVRVVRNRRRKQVEDASYSNMGAAGAGAGAAAAAATATAAGVTTYGTASGMSQTLPPPPLAYATGDRGMAMEAGEIRSTAAAVAPLPVFETLDIGPPLPGSQSSSASDDFLFDATHDMHAAGLDRSVSPGMPSPTGGVTGAAGMAGIVIAAAATSAKTDASNATATNATYTAGHRTIMTGTQYQYEEELVEEEVEVMTSYSNGATHKHNDVGDDDDAFGEAIYGDGSLSMAHAATSTVSVQNTLQAMEEMEAPRAGITSAGYCPESLRADTYLDIHTTTATATTTTATSGSQAMMVGTYGSDAVYLDAAEEFPDVPTVSPSDTRLRMI